MFKLQFIIFSIVIILSNSSFCQSNLTHSEIDSIVASINKSKKLKNVLDTGNIKQGEIKGRFRDCYTIDTTTNELRAFTGSMTLTKTRQTTVTAYYFYESRLIKVEVFDIRPDYKKYNSTYLYYINEPKEQADVFQSKELKKLKYLRLSEPYLRNFKSGKIH